MSISRGERARAENSLNQFLGGICRRRRLRGRKQRGLLELNCLPVAIEVSDAPGAFSEVLLELGPLLSGQVAEEVLVQKLGEFTAVHTLPRRKCGSRSDRRACRARCSRVLTTATLVPSNSAVSSVVIPSMSRSIKTIR